jgi:hypothetical protein
VAGALVGQFRGEVVTDQLTLDLQGKRVPVPRVKLREVAYPSHFAAA